MEIKKCVNESVLEIRVAGRIDGEGANRLEEEILASIRSGAQTIYIHLGEATFLCSAGLRVLLQYWRQMKNAGKLLQATRPSPEVETVLTTSGFKEMLVEQL